MIWEIQTVFKLNRIKYPVLRIIDDNLTKSPSLKSIAHQFYIVNSAPLFS